MVTKEGAERLLEAVEHRCPSMEPMCQDCLIDALAHAVLLLLRNHKGEAYEGWASPDHDHLQRIMGYLKEVVS